MNKRTKMTLVAGAFFTAASVLSSQASAQSYSSDGYYPDSAAQSTDARKKPETLHQAQENAWLEAQRERGNTRSVADIPFPVPSAKGTTTNTRPETARTAAENQWLTRERDVEAGNVAPVPFPVPPSAVNNGE